MKKITTITLICILAVITMFCVACTQPAPTKYTVTFIVEGEEYQVQTITEGLVAQKPTDPQKEQTNVYNYTFKGWKLNGVAYDFNQPVTQDLQLIAEFTSEARVYSVTLMNGDEEIDVISKKVGSRIYKTDITQTPTKESSVTTDYSFYGWKYANGSSVSFPFAVYEDTIIYADYNESARLYEVNFYDGTSLVDTKYFTYDSLLETPEIPTREGILGHNYIFNGWLLADGTKWDNDTMTVKENVDLRVDIYEKGNYENSDPVQRFAVLSDIHLQVIDDVATEKFASAMEQCYEYGDIDGVIIAGDLNDPLWYTQLTFEEHYENQKENAANEGVEGYVKKDEHLVMNNAVRTAEIEHVRKVFEDNIKENTPVLYCLGNHDMARFSVPGGMGTYKISSEKYREILMQSDHNFFVGDDLTKYQVSATQNDLLKYGLRYSRVGNVNFLMLDAQQYWVQENAYNSIQLTWLEEMLAHLKADYPYDPTIIITHYPVQGSVPGSTGTGGTRDFNSILKQYPDTIVVTGHIHRTSADELGMSQNLGFTCIEGSALKGSSGNVYEFTYNEEDYTSSTSSYNAHYTPGAPAHGMIFEVYEDGSIRMKRLSFTENVQTGADWIIPSIGDPTRNIKYTTEVKAQTGTAPYFEQGTMIEAVVDNNFVTVRFDGAKDDDTYVGGYKITATRSNSTTESTTLQHNNATPEGFKYFSTTFENASDIVSIKVEPMDSLNCALGEPIEVLAKDFKTYTQPTFASKQETKQEFGSVTMNGVNFAAGTEYKYDENGVYTNLNRCIKNCESLLNGWGTNYTFQYRISKMQLNNVYTAHGCAINNYEIGATLASWEQNGRRYSLVMQFDFGYATETGSYYERVDTNRIDYYLAVTTPGAITPTYLYNLNLTRDITSDTDIKALLKSDEGAMLTVQRLGTSFIIKVNGEQIDGIDFKNKAIRNNTLTETESGLFTFYRTSQKVYASFNANTISTFGLFCNGAEANYTDYSYVIA